MHVAPALNFAAISAISLLALPASAESNAEYSKEVMTEYGLHSPFIGSNGHNEHWDFGALVSMYDFVRLTGNRQDDSGHAYSRRALEADGWSVEFAFNISAPDSVNPADGLAFWFTEHFFEAGKAFGAREKFKGLGVFFDVYRNHAEAAHVRFPWISAMVNDGTREFEHWNDNHQHAMGGCHREIVNTDGPMYARVTYNGSNLSVDIRSEMGNFENCFVGHNVSLPKRGYVGFSASTGYLYSTHDLLAVVVSRITPSHSEPLYATNGILGAKIFDAPLLGNGLNLSHTHKMHGLGVLLLVVLVGAAAAYGVHLYNAHKLRKTF